MKQKWVTQKRLGDLDIGDLFKRLSQEDEARYFPNPVNIIKEVSDSRGERFMPSYTFFHAVNTRVIKSLGNNKMVWVYE